MTTKVPSEPLAAQAALVTRVEILERGQDTLDEALVTVGVAAHRAEAMANGLKAAVEAAFGHDSGTETLNDVVYAEIEARRCKVEARRSRIAASGLRLVQGGSS